MIDKEIVMGNTETGCKAEAVSSLSRKVSKGMAWIAVSNVLTRGLQIISAIILARLLMPSDFGAVAVCMAVVTFVQGTTDMGFLSALVQRADVDDSYLNTAWTIELLRMTSIALSLIAIAPLFGIFFKDEGVTGLLRLLSLSIFFQGLNSVGLVCLRKELDFYRLFLSEVIPAIAYILLVIPLAFLLKNVWALAFGIVFSSLVTCIVSYMLYPYRPRLAFQSKKALKLFHFGKWIFVQGILVMISEHITTLIMGKYLGMVVLGYYNRATVFSKQISQQVTQFVWRMGFPLYSQLQNEEEKLRTTYFGTMKLLLFTGFPLAGMLLVLSKDFTIILLTEKWLMIVPLMQLFGIFSFFLFMVTPISVLFQSTGRPAISTKLSFLINGVFILSLIPFITLWGASGVVMSSIVSTAVVFPLQLYMVTKVYKIRVWEHLRIFSISFLNTVIMIAVIQALRVMLCNQVSLINFISLGISGGLAYFLSFYVSDKIFNYGLFELIYSRFTALKIK
ncbi:MAG: lipopolysaccharide biosynthesis protein [Candidatus Omnitrophota bacterium]